MRYVMATAHAHISLMSFSAPGDGPFSPIPNSASISVSASTAGRATTLHSASRRHDRRMPWKNNSRNFAAAPSGGRRPQRGSDRCRKTILPVYATTSQCPSYRRWWAIRIERWIVFALTQLYLGFWATVCKKVRPIFYRTVVCLSCLPVCLWRWSIVAKRLDGSRWHLVWR